MVWYVSSIVACCGPGYDLVSQLGLDMMVSKMEPPVRFTNPSP